MNKLVKIVLFFLSTIFSSVQADDGKGLATFICQADLSTKVEIVTIADKVAYADNVLKLSFPNGAEMVVSPVTNDSGTRNFLEKFIFTKSVIGLIVIYKNSSWVVVSNAVSSPNDNKINCVTIFLLKQISA